MVIRQAQEQRKQQKREQVFRAIEEIKISGKPLTFPNIAKVAGCSISYLYKWTELTAYIHDLQDKQNQQLHQVEDKEPGPHSLKTLHEISKQRLRQLEAENTELKRQNEMLRGHVAEIFELRDECERLRRQLRELTQSELSAKIVPLYSPAKESVPREAPSFPKQSISEELRQLGITLNSTLKKTIKAASEEIVLDAIKAYKEAIANCHIERPGGWLKRAIEQGWKPNDIVASKSEKEVFNEWFSRARQKGLVIASQKEKDGIIVYTSDGHCIPFKEMLVKYPLESLRCRNL